MQNGVGVHSDWGGDDLPKWQWDWSHGLLSALDGYYRRLTQCDQPGVGDGCWTKSLR